MEPPLRTDKIADMTDQQLRDWIERCKAMERKAADANTLFVWRQSRQEVEDGLAAREMPKE
jgi:hypothetical protein